MKKVFLQYNPFTIETVIKIEGEMISKDGVLYSYREKRLQEWLDDLFPELVEECNDDIQLTFKGTELDYEDVFLARQDYINSNRDNKVQIDLCPLSFAKCAEERLDELIKLFSEMQTECPFPDLRTEELRRQFQRAIESEFEVSVIATMSSGKSTLINALLGRELMPSKNAACTATIAHIKDVDDMDGYTAICRDESGEIIETNDNLTPEEMSRYNDDENIVDIDIEGDIPFVSSQNMQLVLLDTPGPNNSRTEEHKKRTLRVIKSDDMPMVLYVMNATQLFTEDDESLFNCVADAMNSQHGKQARDRFIFVINKTDMLDTEKGESVSNIINEAREYLKSNGIDDANIYPISAEIAKLIRMNNNGDNLTRKQRINLENSMELFTIEDMHLDEYAPLSVSGREIIKKDITSAKMSESLDDEVLVHTGLPAIEIAIAEYLEKYALTNKINEAVNTFKKRIDEKEIMAKLEDEMSKSEQMREEISEKMNALLAQLEDGKTAQKFRDKLEGLEVGDELVRSARETGMKYAKKLVKIQNNCEMSVEEAREFVNILKKQVVSLERELQVDLENMINKSIVETSQKVIDEYSQHIKSLLEDDNLQLHTYDFNVSFKIMTAHLPTTVSVVNQYTETKTEKVKVGEKTVSDSTWYKPWTWFSEHQEDVFEDFNFQIVNGRKLTEDFIAPIQNSFRENIESAKEEANHQTKDFKKFFIQELDKLDAVMVNKTKELASVASDEEHLNEKIKNNKINQEWLLNFQERLDAVINV